MLVELKSTDGSTRLVSTDQFVSAVEAPNNTLLTFTQGDNIATKLSLKEVKELFEPKSATTTKNQK